MDQESRMSYGKYLTAVVVLGTLIGPVKAQDLIIDDSLETVGSRQCAILGTELDVFLKERLPDCSRFCTVDKEFYTRSRTFNGAVFACADRELAAVPGAESTGGLSGRDAAIGLLGLGLLLGAASGGNGGSTSDTQTSGN
jgi:hypothetical protein